VLESDRWRKRDSNLPLMNNGFCGKFWATIKVVIVVKVIISIVVFVLCLHINTLIY